MRGGGARHGALGQLQAAAGGAVRLGEDQRDFEAGGKKGFESRGREGRRTGEDDAQGRRGGAQAAFFWRFLILARIRFCLSSERCSTKTLP